MPDPLSAAAAGPPSRTASELRLADYEIVSPSMLSDSTAALPTAQDAAARRNSATSIASSGSAAPSTGPRVRRVPRPASAGSGGSPRGGHAGSDADGRPRTPPPPPSWYALYPLVAGGATPQNLALYAYGVTAAVVAAFGLAPGPLVCVALAAWLRVVVLGTAHAMRGTAVLRQGTYLDPHVLRTWMRPDTDVANDVAVTVTAHVLESVLGVATVPRGLVFLMKWAGFLLSLTMIVFDTVLELRAFWSPPQHVRVAKHLGVVFRDRRDMALVTILGVALTLAEPVSLVWTVCRLVQHRATLAGLGPLSYLVSVWDGLLAFVGIPPKATRAATVPPAAAPPKPSASASASAAAAAPPAAAAAAAPSLGEAGGAFGDPPPLETAARRFYGVAGLPLLDQRHTPQNIVLYAVGLGAVGGAGIAMVLCRWWLARPALVFASRTGGVLATAVPWRLVLPTYPSLGVFWVLMSLMHVSEYIATAMYRRDLSLNSFLINHSAAYHGAIAAGVGEYLVTRWLWPGCKDSMGAGAWLAAAGALSMLAVRVAAMVTAGNNFRHLIAETRERDHQLVTRGVYAVLRHPAYTSFFYFGPCLQLVLGNRLCVIAYVVVLWRFFADRIPYEEELLIEFFGDQYTAYRQKTRTWIPFIP